MERWYCNPNCAQGAVFTPRNKDDKMWLWSAICLLFAFCLLPMFAVQAGAQTNNSVWAWGNNEYGQLGDGTTNEHHTPVQVKESEGAGFLTNVRAIATSWAFTFALKSNGTVWAWGINGAGELGDGTNMDSTTPVQVKGPNGIGYLTNVVAIEAGGWHGIALRSDGTVWAWGYNGDGELGDGTTSNRSTPVQVKGPNGVGFLSDVTAISGGGRHTLALRSDGTVWAWGFNLNGQLGDGTANWDLHATPIQVKGPDGVGFLNNVVAIAAAGLSSFALRSNGTVWGWGTNWFGALGDGTTSDRYTPVQVKGPEGIGYLTDVVAISGSNRHSLALRSDGSVWAWGSNDRGQLGNGTTSDHLTPVQVKGPNGNGYLTNVVRIALGGYHSLALRSDGTVWSWEWNYFGQLGDGTAYTNRLTPVQVKGPEGVGYLTEAVAIAASSYHSFALIPVPRVTVSGSVTLEGSATTKGQALFFDFLPVSGEQQFSRSIRATETFSLPNVPHGRYNVWIKGDKWLAKSIPIDTTQGDVVDVNVLLLAGDANNDNFVDVFDLDVLIAAFDSAVGDPNWNEGADLNCDGAVDVRDLNLLIKNFDRVGDF